VLLVVEISRRVQKTTAIFQAALPVTSEKVRSSMQTTEYKRLLLVLTFVQGCAICFKKFLATLTAISVDKFMLLLVKKELIHAGSLLCLSLRL
jgi:hypothetical protein